MSLDRMTMACATASKYLFSDANCRHSLAAVPLRIEQREFLPQRKPGLTGWGDQYAGVFRGYCDRQADPEPGGFGNG
jgi:hypothetical protein